MTHPHLTTYERNFKQETISGVDKEFITGQLKETARLFKETTGKDMISFWRAPYGEQNAEIRQWAYEAGFTHIGWTRDYKTKETLDSLDWVSNEESEFYHSADEIKNRILNFDKGGNEVMGGIVLMHLGTERKDSRASAKLPEIIDSLEGRGYRFVKVSELLERSR
jgi:peptidoglycan/xylan/chitin deacetylase (PgdA/CDA1 family)